ncbi:ABC transporter permease [Xanthomonas albilineans]|uniref:ABC transporter permease n=1 Tax=Xanthomonas albilineans TaxID=29447 RepID=UPI0005F3475D|nr:FtsX-like permease family protein [Xanthomonas albilineans]
MSILRPYLAPLRRHPLMPLLVIAQTTVACAILLNVLFLLWQKLAPMLVADGIPRGELVIVDQVINQAGNWNAAQILTATDALRKIPGVKAVSPMIGLPMSSSLTVTVLLKGPAGSEIPSLYSGDTALDALGLELSAGRRFSPNEMYNIDLLTSAVLNKGNTPVILTEALARRLFGAHPALGGILTSRDPQDTDHFVVVGLVRHLLRYQLDELDDGKAEFSMLTPGKITNTPILNYAVRVAPEQRDAVIAQIAPQLKRALGADLMHGTEPKVSDYESQRNARLKPRRAAVWLFGSVSVLVTAITLIGIASLSGFWIQQRTRQIGIRRALGATRTQILHQFQLENLLIIGTGLVLGIPMAYAANLWLMQHYELTRLPAICLPIGVGVLLIMGQLAVFGPARRAAAMPPAIATRHA